MDCSIAFKCGTEFYYVYCVTGDTLQMFKVKGQSQGYGVKAQALRAK